MQYELVKLTADSINAVKGMLSEWDSCDDRRVPKRIWKVSPDNFDEYMSNVNAARVSVEGTSQVYFLRCKNNGAMLGAVDIRLDTGESKHYIEFCIRPTHRGMGYGDVALRTILAYCADTYASEDGVYVYMPNNSEHLQPLFDAYVVKESTVIKDGTQRKRLTLKLSNEV